MEYIAFFAIAWLTLLIPGFDDSVPPTGDKIFKIEYSDVVQSITTKSDEYFGFQGFDIELKQNSDTYLDIKIPKNLPIPASFINIWHYDERPIVLADGMEIGYDIVDDPCYSHYKIPIEEQKSIEVIYGVILTGDWKLYSPIQFDVNDPCYNKVLDNVPASENEEQIPLKLDDFASELWYDHEFIIDGTILDIRGYGEQEKVYDIQINAFFKPAEGAGSKIITVYGSPNFYNVKGDRGIFFIKKDDAKWIFGEYGAKITGECLPELMYHNPRLIDPPLTRGLHPTDYSLLVDCYPHYYKKYLPQYMKARGATEFPSPNTQAIDGVPPDEIVCNRNLELVTKRDGSPACVKLGSVSKLIERGWSRVENSIMITGTDMSINYQTSDGKIFSIEGYSQEASGIGQIAQTSLFLMLDVTNHGEVTLILPRDVIDTKVGNIDDNFFVVLDEMETEYTETKTDTDRTISFSFPAGTKNVEIIGYGYYNDRFSNYPG